MHNGCKPVYHIATRWLIDYLIRMLCQEMYDCLIRVFAIKP